MKKTDLNYKTSRTTAIEQKDILIDYIINCTDYFLTARTSILIKRDFQNILGINFSYTYINNYLRNPLNNQLLKSKITKIGPDGNIIKQGRIIYSKNPEYHAVKQDLSSYDPVYVEAITKMFKRYTDENTKIYKVEVKEETSAIRKLYDVIVANPGKRVPFYLTIFDIKVKLLESRLQKLLDKKKIEYRGIGKSGGYWVIKGLK